jgi:phage protein D
MGQNDITNAQINIKIGGSAVSPAFMRSLRDVVVETNLHLPAMFTIRLQDNDAKWADNSSLIKIGNPVEVAVTAPNQGNRSGASGTLIKGEITALEPSFNTIGALLTIVGYCKSHRLHRGKKTKTWLRQKDSAIVSALVSEAGLSATVEDSAVLHEYVIQYNQTDWEFLSERATRIGYRFYVEDQRLHFKKAAHSTQNAPDLSWGDNLRSFRPRLTAAQNQESDCGNFQYRCACPDHRLWRCSNHRCNYIWVGNSDYSNNPTNHSRLRHCHGKCE